MDKFTTICSCCGRRSREISMDSLHAARLAADGWSNYGSAVYCPKCAITRNKHDVGETKDIRTTALVIMDEMVNQLESEIRYLKGEYDD